jgi:hypothetical protein
MNAYNKIWVPPVSAQVQVTSREIQEGHFTRFHCPPNIYGTTKVLLCPYQQKSKYLQLQYGSGKDLKRAPEILLVFWDHVEVW